MIYVSLGTLFNADPAFYRTCFDAFGGQGARVIMSIGTAIAEASLGPPPANVVVKPWVSQLDVLRRTSVFVSHGGMNSVSESLHHGVPLVLVPQMGEQEIVARRVEDLGAGLCITKESRRTCSDNRSVAYRATSGSEFRPLWESRSRPRVEPLAAPMRSWLSLELERAAHTRSRTMNEARVALNRRHFLACLSAMGLGSTLMPDALTIAAQDADIVTIEVLEAAQKIAGVSFTRAEQQAILTRLNAAPWIHGRVCRVAHRQPSRR